MGTLSLEDMLPSEIISILNESDVCHSVSTQDGKYIAELEFYTDYGGDQILNIWFDYKCEGKNDSKIKAAWSFAESLYEYWSDFDVDGYVETWLVAKSERPDICPLNARQLVEDAGQIESFIDELYTKIRNELNRL